MLVTGFKPFGTLETNPSQWLAENCGQEHRILDVTYAAVQEFWDEIEFNPPQKLLLLGVAVRATTMRIEVVARNVTGATPDNNGFGGHAAIQLGSPSLAATLWPAALLANPPEGVECSFDAGDYLCNFSFFGTLAKFPNVQAGFLHVPPESTMNLNEQLAILKQVIHAITSS